MGGSGSNYLRNKHGLTEDDLKRTINRGDGDAYIFDVEYQKLKLEKERLEKEYARARERFLSITEELRREMENGTASEADEARFMAMLTDKGVALQQEQVKTQKMLEDVGKQQADVDREIDKLRKVAFSGATKASYQPADRNEQYKGFKNTNWGQSKVVEMSPVEYLRRMAFQFGNGNIESLLRTASPREIEKIARQMRRGTSFNSPALDFLNSKGDGAKHVLAALLNGYKRIPVLMIGEGT